MKKERMTLEEIARQKEIIQKRWKLYKSIPDIDKVVPKFEDCFSETDIDYDFWKIEFIFKEVFGE